MGITPQQPEQKRVRTRAERIAKRVSYESFTDKVSKLLTDEINMIKLGLFVAAAAIVCVLCKQWDPPAEYCLNTYADRNIVSKANFQVESPDLRNVRIVEARANSKLYLVNDPERLDAYQGELLAGMQLLLARPDLMQCDNRDLEYLKEFKPNSLRENTTLQTFETLRDFFSEDAELANLRRALEKALEPYRRKGVLLHLNTLNFTNGVENLNRIVEIMVYDKGDVAENARLESVSDVLFGSAYNVKTTLAEELGSVEIANLVSKKIARSIPETLELDVRATQKQQDHDVAQVAECYLTYEVGDVIVSAGQRIGKRELRLLEAERAELLKNRTWEDRAIRFTASFALLTLLFLGSYFLFSHKLIKPGLPEQEHPIAATLVFIVMAILCVGAGRLLQEGLHNGFGSPELIPLLVFVQLTALATAWEIALTFGVILGFFFNIASPSGLDVFTVFVGSTLVTAIMSRNVRTRSQLFLVAATTALTAFVLSFAGGYVCDEQTNILRESSLRGLWAFAAGFLTSGFLPLFERVFGVLTPMRLLEYSNPSHPLLLELNLRAPATYSHSIQTAALAEPAAEAIGARSELVRVGAYFHDVGKMLQPENFTENQKGRNIHDELEPRLSVLIIVAHTKDGVDLAKRYKLPRQVIDLIEQHHGTMNVGIFYQKAKKMLEEKDPTAPPLDDSAFRYPGPRPKTKEAGVLMIADAVESASRSLSDWSPRRVENLVHAIVEKRIEDGQFNESGLTLGDINTIEQSLVTTLLASRHTRVKYEVKDAVKEPKEAAKDAKDAGKDPKRPESEANAPHEDYSKPPIDDLTLFGTKDSGETVRSVFKDATQK